MNLLDLVTGPWAILPEQLLEMQEIYATHLRGDKIDIPSVEARLGRPLASEQQRYELRDGGVAVLHAGGVMAPKANMFMQISGGISTQMLTQQFNGMAADPRVKAVVFAPDSPGGNVLGVPAAAKALAALASAKPTVTVGEGVIASAMYWVASAANAVFIEGETDMAGSLGVVATLNWEPEKPNSRTLVRGRYKRVSVDGQAPTAEVLAHHDAQLDYLYALLVDNVAANRRVTSDQVLEHMADGRVFIGQQAIDAGLVDGVSTVEAMVEQLATNPDAFRGRRKAVFALGAPGARSLPAGVAAETSPESDAAGAVAEGDLPPTHEGATMAETITREALVKEHPALFAQLQTEFTGAGAAAERQRIADVRAQTLPGHEALIEQLAFDGKTTGAEAAMAIVVAQRQATAAAAAAHFKDAPAAAPAAAAPDKPATKSKTEQVAEAKAYAAEHKVEFVAALKALGYAD